MTNRAVGQWAVVERVTQWHCEVVVRRAGLHWGPALDDLVDGGAERFHRRRGP